MHLLLKAAANGKLKHSAVTDWLVTLLQRDRRRNTTHFYFLPTSSNACWSSWAVQWWLKHRLVCNAFHLQMSVRRLRYYPIELQCLCSSALLSWFKEEGFTLWNKQSVPQLSISTLNCSVALTVSETRIETSRASHITYPRTQSYQLAGWGYGEMRGSRGEAGCSYISVLCMAIFIKIILTENFKWLWGRSGRKHVMIKVVLISC